AGRRGNGPQVLSADVLDRGARRVPAGLVWVLLSWLHLSDLARLCGGEQDLSRRDQPLRPPVRQASLDRPDRDDDRQRERARERDQGADRRDRLRDGAEEGVAAGGEVVRTVSPSRARSWAGL